MVGVLGFLLFLKIMPNLSLGQCVKESTKPKGQGRKCQAGNTLESSWVGFSLGWDVSLWQFSLLSSLCSSLVPKPRLLEAD